MSQSFEHFIAGNHTVDFFPADQNDTGDFGMRFQMGCDFFCDGFGGHLIFMRRQLTY